MVSARLPPVGALFFWHVPAAWAIENRIYFVSIEAANSQDLSASYGIPTDCHPKITCLFDYWLSIRPAAGVLPGRQHFDPREIHRLLNGIALIDVVHDPLRFRMRLVGTHIAEFRGCDRTGEWMDEAFPGFPGTDAHRQYIEAVETGTPRWVFGPASVSREGNRERILLPLASDGRRVDMLLVLLLYMPVRKDIPGG